MENASKALIIAGSILIAILLISAALLVMNSISSVTEQSEAISKSMEIQMSNSKISEYFGTSVPGSKVKALLSEIMVNNSTASEPILVNAYKIFEQKTIPVLGHSFGAWKETSPATTETKPMLSPLRMIVPSFWKVNSAAEAPVMPELMPPVSVNGSPPFCAMCVTL